jgi:hypothetical protein
MRASGSWSPSLLSGATARSAVPKPTVTPFASAPGHVPSQPRLGLTNR